jgi:hypothetical protein
MARRKALPCASKGCPRGEFALGYCSAHRHRYVRWGRDFAEIPIGDPALRRVTSIAPQQRSRSGIRGVRRLPSGRWDTRVVVGGVEYRAGVFDTVEDAAAAVAALRAELVNNETHC